MLRIDLPEHPSPDVGSIDVRPSFHGDGGQLRCCNFVCRVSRVGIHPDPKVQVTVHIQVIPVADAWDMSEDRAVISDGARVGVREANVPPNYSNNGRVVLVYLCDWGRGSNLDIHSALQASVDKNVISVTSLRVPIGRRVTGCWLRRRPPRRWSSRGSTWRMSRRALGWKEMWLSLCKPGVAKIVEVGMGRPAMAKNPSCPRVCPRICRASTN